MRRMAELRSALAMPLTVALGLVAASAMAADLNVQRSEGQVNATDSKGAPLPLAVLSAIPVQSKIQTVSDGRIAMLVNGGGLLVLGMDSELILDGSEPADPPARSALLRLRLNSGVLRIDARKHDQTAPADIRLTLPNLSMRIYGGEAWIQSAPDGDEVCSLSGAIEVQTPRGTDRLDRPNECLRWGDGSGEHMAPGKRRGLAVDFLRTSFGDDPEAQYAAQQELNRGNPVVIDSTPAVAATMPATPAPAVTPAPLPVASAPIVTAAATPAIAAVVAPVTTPAPVTAVSPGNSNGRWRLVLGSFSDRPHAEQAMQQWQALKPELSEAAGIGRVYYRVLSGNYASRQDADVALLKLKRNPQFAAAWPVQLP